jgi:hypothetical protein
MTILLLIFEKPLCEWQRGICVKAYLHLGGTATTVYALTGSCFLRLRGYSFL